MFEQYSTPQLYDLHSHLSNAARSLHLAWATHLAATDDPTHVAGDTATAVSVSAQEVHAELKRRYDARQAIATAP